MLSNEKAEELIASAGVKDLQHSIKSLRKNIKDWLSAQRKKRCRDEI